MLEQGRGIKLSSGSSNQYPAPLAKYEDVVANRQLFMTTLEKLHAAMCTKFMIPIIGGRDLDLHKLFIEVTSRGGIEKILGEKKWKDVTATFNFPSTATNASFVLRKYYYSLLQHYERIYYFKAHGWTPSSTDFPLRLFDVYIKDAIRDKTRQSKWVSLGSYLEQYGCGYLRLSAIMTSGAVHTFPKMSGVPTQVEGIQQPSINSTEFASGGEGDGTASTMGSSVIGVIDGKFESGYLITVTVDNQKLKGVLYQTPLTHVHRKRRRRRRKCEIKRRDPAHPKPNRSGYNFFFAEQHARLKPLYPGKDRQISRMIGELWNGLKDNEKAIYQDKALRDKERYKMEMENYRERSQVISEAVPTQQKYESNSSKSDSEEDEEEDEEDEDYDDYENLSEAEASLAAENFQADEKGCQESQRCLNQSEHQNSISSTT